MTQNILTGEESVIIPANKRLKKKVGSSKLSDLITDKKIEAAQARSTESAKAQFMDDVHEDIKRISELAGKVKTTDTDKHEPLLDEIRDISFRIKSRAGTFDYALASAVARLLYNFLDQASEITAKELHIFDAAVNTLKAVFANNIHGDGGKIGQELHGNLITLMENRQTA